MACPTAAIWKCVHLPTNTSLSNRLSDSGSNSTPFCGEFISADLGDISLLAETPVMSHLLVLMQLQLCSFIHALDHHILEVCQNAPPT